MSRTRFAAALLGAFALAAQLPATAAATSPPTKETGQAVLGANQVAMGDRVPWGLVGRGWYLTLIDQGPRRDYGIQARHQLLDLVDPYGGRYQMVKTPVAEDGTGYRQLMDWSIDGRRALVLVGGGSRHARAIEYHLRSGHPEVIPVGKRISTVALGPKGSLYATRYGGNGGALVRLNADGTHELLMPDTDGMALPSPNGHRIVVGAARYHDHTLRVLSGHGTPVRTLALPYKCAATRWWTHGTVLASCYLHSGASRLYAVPVDGSAPTSISAKHDKHSADLGDLDARVLGGTTYLEASGPCGVVFLARQHRDGAATEVHVPGSTGNVYLLGTRGHRLVIQTGVSCDGGPTHDAIAHFDPTTGADRVVAELPVGEAYNTVLAFGERRTTIG